MSLLFLIPVTFAAGLVQGTVGFGSGIVMMMLLPMLYPVPQAAGVSCAIGIVLSIQMIVVYRKSVSWKSIPGPVVIYLLFSSIAINFSKAVDQNLLRALLGLFLIGLCLYYLLRKTGEPKELSRPAALGAMVFSGICSGLFGIGGPLMMVYFMGRLKDNIKYLATIQGFFIVTSLYNSAFRVAEGVLQVQHLLPIAVGAVGIFFGGLVAKKIVSRMDPKILIKCIYAMLGISGVINIVNALI